MRKTIYTLLALGVAFAMSACGSCERASCAQQNAPKKERKIAVQMYTFKNYTFEELGTIITGKKDANFATKNGEYNFYTCSQATMKCDSPDFNCSAIIIAGNGDFNVKHYTGEFNAYQRTYVIEPKNIKHYVYECN